MESTSFEKRNEALLFIALAKQQNKHPVHEKNQSFARSKKNIMSSITVAAARRAVFIPRALVVPASRRTFITSPVYCKTATETVKDGLKKADRAVSDNIVLPGIDAASMSSLLVES